MLPASARSIENYVTADEEQALLAALDAGPWLKDLQRRVQHHGYRYDYDRGVVERDMYLGPLPAWAEPLVQRFHEDGIIDAPDQLIVNEYLPGQGIAPHIDCRPCFGPVVVSLSLGSACVMELSRGEERLPLVLPPRSLLVLAGEARSRWRHGIRPRRSDVIEGVRRPRGRRVSLTFRTVTLLVE